MENYSKHKHDGTVNPVREGETLVQVWQRNGMTSPGHFCSPAANLIWRECGDDTITDYAVSPPRFVDWSKPLVTNMGTTPRGVLGPDNSGCYDVTGDFGEGVEKRYFNADGSHAFGKPIYVRNAPEAADKPDTAAIEKRAWLHVPDSFFAIGQPVKRKGDGAQWHGAVVGFYRPSNGKLGIAVESDFEKGSVQIYPQHQLEAWK